MPARKPQGLKKRHDTKDEQVERIANENAMAPHRDLPLNPPRQLRGHPIARSVWRRVIKVYNEIEAKIVTAMDLDNLLDLCIGIEQLDEMDRMRAAAVKMWESLQEVYSDLKKQHAEPDQILRAAELTNIAYDKITKLDARCDQKRKMLLSLRQSLYLTPRARSAAAPSKKEKPPEKDPFESLLDETVEFVSNGCVDDKG